MSKRQQRIDDEHRLFDLFIPEATRIVKECLGEDVILASPFEDYNLGTDLKSEKSGFGLRTIRYPVKWFKTERIYKPWDPFYHERKTQITLRLDRIYKGPGGSKIHTYTDCEIYKMFEKGIGDKYLYGIAIPYAEDLERYEYNMWRIIDINAWRDNKPWIKKIEREVWASSRKNVTRRFFPEPDKETEQLAFHTEYWPESMKKEIILYEWFREREQGTPVFCNQERPENADL